MKSAQNPIKMALVSLFLPKNIIMWFSRIIVLMAAIYLLQKKKKEELILKQSENTQL